MKTMIFLLLALLPFLLYAQGYVTMSALKTEKPKLHLSASTGYQYKRVITEAKMYVPLTNDYGYPAYFMANGGYVFCLSSAWQLCPLVGYGYALESTTYKGENKWVWSGALRVVHKALVIDAGVLDKKAFASIGVIGFLNN